MNTLPTPLNPITVEQAIHKVLLATSEPSLEGDLEDLLEKAK